MRTRSRATLIAAALALTVSACSGAGATDSQGAANDDATETTEPSVAPYTAGEPLDCATIDPTTWRIAPSEYDAIHVVQTNTYPLPPLEGVARQAEPTVIDTYETPEDYLGQSNVADKLGRRDAMVEAGYKSGIEADFDAYPGTGHGVQVLEFSDSAAAADYAKVHLARTCDFDEHPVALSDDGGIAYGSTGFGFAVFVIGPYEVTLSLCNCVQADPIEVVQAWYQTWMTEQSSGPAEPLA